MVESMQFQDEWVEPDDEDAEIIILTEVDEDEEDIPWQEKEAEWSIGSGGFSRNIGY
jgi:hypothetical protein